MKVLLPKKKGLTGITVMRLVTATRLFDASTPPCKRDFFNPIFYPKVHINWLRAAIVGSVAGAEIEME